MFEFLGYFRKERKGRSRNSSKRVGFCRALFNRRKGDPVFKKRKNPAPCKKKSTIAI